MKFKVGDKVTVLTDDSDTPEFISGKLIDCEIINTDIRRYLPYRIKELSSGITSWIHDYQIKEKQTTKEEVKRKVKQWVLDNNITLEGLEEELNYTQAQIKHNEWQLLDGRYSADKALVIYDEMKAEGLILPEIKKYQLVQELGDNTWRVWLGEGSTFIFHGHSKGYGKVIDEKDIVKIGTLKHGSLGNVMVSFKDDINLDTCDEFKVVWEKKELTPEYVKFTGETDSYMVNGDVYKVKRYSKARSGLTLLSNIKRTHLGIGASLFWTWREDKFELSTKEAYEAQAKVTEMTVAEIEKELGLTIKIVK